MKLWFVKVGKLDVCIRPLFANSVTNNDLVYEKFCHKALELNLHVFKAFIYVCMFCNSYVLSSSIILAR